MAGRFRSLEVADLGSELLLPADVISSNGTSCGGWNPVLYLEMTACESYNQRKKWVASEDSAKCPQHTISRTTCEICIETTRILSHREKKTGIQHNVKKDCAAVGRKLLSATFGRHGGTDLRFVGPQPDTSWSRKTMDTGQRVARRAYLLPQLTLYCQFILLGDISKYVWTKLSKVALDCAAAGIEPAISSRKSNTQTTVPPSTHAI